MSLVKVNIGRAYTFNLVCYRCKREKDHSMMHADTSGLPFVAYYCPDCIATDKNGELVIKSEGGTQ